MKYFITIEKEWSDYVVASNEEEAVNKALDIFFNTNQVNVYVEDEIED